MASLGDAVRRLRKEKGYTQRELARLVGIDATYLSKIENDRLDEAQTPRESTLRRLASALAADPDELLLLARRIPQSLRSRILSRPDLFTAISWLDPGQFESLLSGLDASARTAAGQALLGAHRFLQSILDSLVSHVAVLDRQGDIVVVNAAWRAFAAENGLSPETCSEGTNYLRVCDRASGEWSDGADLVAAAIRGAAESAGPPVEFEYPCHSPAQRRWFTVRITSFGDAGSRHVVVAHDDITRRRTAELARFPRAEDCTLGAP